MIRLAVVHTVQLINDLHILREQRLLWGCRHKAQGVSCRQVAAKPEPITHEVRHLQSLVFAFMSNTN